MVRSVATDNTGFEADTPEFALYKNSRFKECYNLVPDAANCSQIRSGLGALANGVAHIPQGFHAVSSIHGWKTRSSEEARSHPAIYDWCQIVSCFNGFKIIPSTARPSATILPDILCWWAVMFTSTSALVHTGKQLRGAFREKRKPCRGWRELSWLDWIFFAYDVCGPIFWWWVSFGTFAAGPSMSASTAFVSWVTTWKLASVMQFHPYSCALPGGRRAKRVIPQILNAMALLQWAASAYVLSVYWGDLGGRGSTLQSYDCVVSEMENAPGSTPCSAADLCSKTAFFRGAQFEYNDSFQASGRYNLLAYFFIWTLMALLPFVFLFISWCGSVCRRSSAKTRRDDAGYTWRVFNRGPHFYLAFAAFITLITTVGYAIHVLKTWDSPRNREGPFVFHSECNALHVPLSPWRDYLDISEYARAFRIAKMVFNA